MLNTGQRYKPALPVRQDLKAERSHGELVRLAACRGTQGVFWTNLLLWKKTDRPVVPLDVFRLGQPRRSNSALASRQSDTRTIQVMSN